MNARRSPTDLEHTLRMALRSLESRWPRFHDAQCQRDTEAVQLLQAALENIEAGKRLIAETMQGARNVAAMDGSTVTVRPDSATREITLSIQLHGAQVTREMSRLSLVFPADASHRLGAMLVASAEVLGAGQQGEGGAA